MPEWINWFLFSERGEGAAFLLALFGVGFTEHCYPLRQPCLRSVHRCDRSLPTERKRGVMGYGQPEDAFKDNRRRHKHRYIMYKLSFGMSGMSTLYKYFLYERLLSLKSLLWRFQNKKYYFQSIFNTNIHSGGFESKRSHYRCVIPDFCTVIEKPQTSLWPFTLTPLFSIKIEFCNTNKWLYPFHSATWEADSRLS